jgi:uncharacterized protein (DUF169 family)
VDIAEATMQSKISSYLKLQTEPVVTLWTDRLPEKKIQFARGKRGCVMSLLAASAKGRVCVVDKETFGCPGGGVGLGYGNQYENFPGGVDCFTRFLSSGNKGYPKGEGVANHMAGKAPEQFIEEYLDGERYVKSPELVEDFIRELGFMDLPEYTVFKPLSKVEARDTPVSVTFFCNPDQLSALVVLCNYHRKGIENAIAPFSAGCQSVGILTYKQFSAENPKAVIGMFDITARKVIKSTLGDNLLTVSLPFSLFQQMEADADESFLTRENWKDLIGS